jgi:hypothetical protein
VTQFARACIWSVQAVVVDGASVACRGSSRRPAGAAGDYVRRHSGVDGPAMGAGLPLQVTGHSSGDGPPNDATRAGPGPVPDLTTHSGFPAVVRPWREPAVRAMEAFVAAMSKHVDRRKRVPNMPAVLSLLAAVPAGRALSGRWKRSAHRVVADFPCQPEAEAALQASGPGRGQARPPHGFLAALTIPPRPVRGATG